VEGYRRVPGLRREELAMLAGVSVDYYMRLEQGRDVRPSDQVVDSLARVLRLTPAQTDHLHTLTRLEHQAGGEMPGETVDPNVRRLVDFLDTPAMVRGRGTAVLAYNQLFGALVSDFAARPARERYYAYWVFADPTARSVLLEWDQFARETVGVLRADATRFPADQQIAALIDLLSSVSAQFRSLWAEHDVEAPTSGSKRYRHAIAGEMTVFHEATVLENEQGLYLYWVEPGSTSETRMQQLRRWVADNAQRDGGDRTAASDRRARSQPTRKGRGTHQLTAEP
jgi:transcriptional regulator with XRE-family HTH domain